MKTKDPMPVRALAPWFGAGRMIAPLVGRELSGCKWVGVPFAGGMSEIAEIDARSVAVTQTNQAKAEVLIVNGPSRADGGMFR